MPVRQEFLYTRKEDARQALGLDERPVIVSAWGSLGAREMNKVIADFFRLEQEAGCPYQHIHATGSYGWRWMPEYVKERGVDLLGCSGLEMVEYIYDMPTWHGGCGLDHRSGWWRLTLEDIAASGMPALIVPSSQRHWTTTGRKTPGFRADGGAGAAQYHS